MPYFPGRPFKYPDQEPTLKNTDSTAGHYGEALYWLSKRKYVAMTIKRDQLNANMEEIYILPLIQFLNTNRPMVFQK